MCRRKRLALLALLAGVIGIAPAVAGHTHTATTASHHWWQQQVVTQPPPTDTQQPPTDTQQQTQQGSDGQKSEPNGHYWF